MNPATGTGKYEQLLKRCESLTPIPTAVAHPCDATALAGAMEASKQRLIVPILVGPVGKIREISASAGIDLGQVQFIDAPHSHAAAAKAVELNEVAHNRSASSHILSGRIERPELTQVIGSCIRTSLSVPLVLASETIDKAR